MCSRSRVTVAILLASFAADVRSIHAITAAPVAVDRAAIGPGSPPQANSAALAIPAAPPRVIFSSSPAVLVLIDGEPVYRDVQGTALRRIVNTRSLIVRNQAGIHYLKMFDGWMESYFLSGRWTPSGVTPEGGADALRQALAGTDVDLLTGGRLPDPAADLDSTPAPVPTVYVSTEPAALIVTDGPARYLPIEGTSLTRAENTSTDIFRAADGQLYVLLSGRWLSAPRSSGPWRYVTAGALPRDFARLPDGSLKRRVDASLAADRVSR
jgi:hypothetical protein